MRKYFSSKIFLKTRGPWLAIKCSHPTKLIRSHLPLYFVVLRNFNCSLYSSYRKSSETSFEMDYGQQLSLSNPCGFYKIFDWKFWIHLESYRREQISQNFQFPKHNLIFSKSSFPVGNLLFCTRSPVEIFTFLIFSPSVGKFPFPGMFIHQPIHSLYTLILSFPSPSFAICRFIAQILYVMWTWWERRCESDLCIWKIDSRNIIRVSSCFFYCCFRVLVSVCANLVVVCLW